MPGTQKEDAASATEATHPSPAAEPTTATPEVPRPRRESAEAKRSVVDAGESAAAQSPANTRQPAEPRRRPASAPAAAYEPEPERMPLLARVLLADFAVAVVALVVLFIIEVQRFDDATVHLRRQAWIEDLAVLFLVSVLFGVVTFLLFRAGRTRVALVQVVVTALVLIAAITSAATGDPKPTSADIPTPTGSSSNPG
ncbi:hypothetical protein [Catenulispora acidiphila]|nr:hypothetical protein [Catenulispora acidiphila]